MVAAAKPGGRIVVLDYNHTKARWEPEPPLAFTRFYQAFLAWRAQAGMDNEVADHLATMLAQRGLTDIQTSDGRELTVRGDPDFETRSALWPSVIATRGHQMVSDHMLSEPERAAAEEAFAGWVRTSAKRQSLYLLAVSATK
jgi:hypothetical protein